MTATNLTVELAALHFGSNLLDAQPHSLKLSSNTEDYPGLTCAVLKSFPARKLLLKFDPLATWHHLRV